MNDPVAVAVPRGTVYLAPTLTVPMASGAIAALNETPANEGAMQATLVSVCMQPAPRGAILSWDGPRFTRKGENGLNETEPLTDEAIIRLLPWGEGGMEVSERFAGLYAEDLFRPLARRHQPSSPPGPIDSSMSPNPEPGSARPKPSRRSSQNGTAGMRSVVPAR